MSTLGEWTDAVAAELDLAPELDRTLLLDLARDAAHGVARPAAPLTTYLLGVAVGRGADPVAAAARLSELAARWSAAHAEPAAPQDALGGPGSQVEPPDGPPASPLPPR